jgi:hypothetical protein
MHGMLELLYGFPEVGLFVGRTHGLRVGLSRFRNDPTRSNISQNG